MRDEVRRPIEDAKAECGAAFDLLHRQFSCVTWPKSMGFGEFREVVDSMTRTLSELAYAASRRYAALLREHDPERYRRGVPGRRREGDEADPEAVGRGRGRRE